MKGLVLAGGNGTRLYPYTKSLNKHTVLLYDRPLIFYPIQTLAAAGVKDIMVMLGGNSVGDIVKLLGDGKDFGVNLSYKLQDGAWGIAHALGLARDFAAGESIAMILGDNVFLSDDVDLSTERGCARIFLAESDTPERFGVAKFNSKGQLSGIIEKPKRPPSNMIVTGLYVYPPDVYDFIDTLEPSDRGELEITDVNNWFLREKKLSYRFLPEGSSWTDAGTFESLFKASEMIRKLRGLE